MRIKSKTIEMELLFMNIFGEEKRKNDALRHFPWRAVFFLVIGFALGVVVTLLFTPSGTNSITVISGDDFARAEISDVEPAPDNIQQEAQIDPIYVTATYIIQRATAIVETQKLATQQAQATPSASP
jgi:hypothetical protein